jgi:hypothetical protein
MSYPNLTGGWMRYALTAGAALSLFGPPSIVVAQDFVNLFPQSLFGGEQSLSPQPQPRAPIRQRRHFARVRQKHHSKHHAAVVDAAPPGSANCVRLCDGRYFQLAESTAKEANALCVAACPNASTAVFFGDGEIRDAVDSDGKKYSDLPNAFAYQEHLVADCSCKEGRMGMATIDVEKDPTLRPGDIVTTQEGPVTFDGSDQQQATIMSAKNHSDIAPDIRRYQTTLSGKDDH